MNTLKFKATLQGESKTAVEVPDNILQQLGAGKKPKVKVTIHGHTFRTSIGSRGGKYWIPVSAEVKELAGVKGGDTKDIGLELDTDPRIVTIPPDLERALEKSAAARKFYESLSYSRQQRYVLPIGQAKTEETRQRRIEKMISDLEAGKK